MATQTTPLLARAATKGEDGGRTDPLGKSTHCKHQKVQSSMNHETDKQMFDRNIFQENKSPTQLSNEIYWLFDLLEE